MEKINECQNCQLYKNQKPLLDNNKKTNIFFVGLSAKIKKDQSETPLDETTNSGSIIKQIENEIKTQVYKTNIVKCVPLNNNKLRYPNKIEMDSCYNNFLTEIKKLNPKIIFLLGNQVTKFIENKNNIILKNNQIFKINNIYYISIKHPSYIYVYKRKEINIYIEKIKNIINQIGSE